MTYDRAALRALTQEDNFEWLRSFGCTVEQRGDLTLVDHSSLTEYKAWLFTRGTPQAVRQLGDAIATSTGARTIYIDDEVANAAVANLLANARIAGRNVTVAAQVPRRGWRSSTPLVPADAGDWRQWSDIYSRGFSREDRAEIDRERWRLAFASPRVRHWFFVQNGARVGVCQTTTGPVHGIYSFTFVPEARGLRAALNGLRALLKYVAQQPSPWLYFEVLSQSPLLRTRVQSAIGLTAVRTLIGYELS
jgi:hypothetical protein